MDFIFIVVLRVSYIVCQGGGVARAVGNGQKEGNGGTSFGFEIQIWI